MEVDDRAFWQLTMLVILFIETVFCDFVRRSPLLNEEVVDKDLEATLVRAGGSLASLSNVAAALDGCGGLGSGAGCKARTAARQILQGSFSALSKPILI